MEFKWHQLSDNAKWGDLTIKFGNTSHTMYVMKDTAQRYISYCMDNVNDVVKLLDAVERGIKENYLKAKDEKQQSAN